MVRLDGAGLPRGVGPARYQLRRVHPHHPAAPRAHRPEVLERPLRKGLALQGPLRGLVLRARGDLLRGIRPGKERGRRLRLPRVPPSRAAVLGRRKLVLQDERLPGRPAQVLRRASRLHPAGHPPQRGRQLREERVEGPFDFPFDLRLGRAPSLRRGPRGLRVGRRPALLLYRLRLCRPRPRRRVRSALAHELPLRGQGHRPLPLRDLAGHAHGRRLSHHPEGVRPRLFAHQGREDEQVQGQRRDAQRPRARLRRRCLPLLLHERRPVRP